MKSLIGNDYMNDVAFPPRRSYGVFSPTLYPHDGRRKHGLRAESESRSQKNRSITRGEMVQKRCSSPICWTAT